MARYEVGAVKQHGGAEVAAIAVEQVGGAAFSSSTVEAPTRIGNSSSPPRPKVKASGGLPMKTSSGVGAQHVRREAARSGHHVAVEVHRALGLPVVPEVKAIRQVSSAAVSTLSKLRGWRGHRAPRGRRRRRR